MVNSSLYCWSDTTCWFGPSSWIRMRRAITPATRKKKNEVIRYRCPMILWSVEDSQYARMLPLRSVFGVT